MYRRTTWIWTGSMTLLYPSVTNLFKVWFYRDNCRVEDGNCTLQRVIRGGASEQLAVKHKRHKVASSRSSIGAGKFLSYLDPGSRELAPRLTRDPRACAYLQAQWAVCMAPDASIGPAKLQSLGKAPILSLASSL